MDEEFGSFVVTDPDLVDEGIDVSGLRTKTDTSLLGNIPELAGVQYEAFNPNRLTDLMRFYQTGLPTRSVSQPTTPPATGGGGSGGGGQVIAIPGTIDTLVTPSANTPEEQRLIDEGIGLQIAPGSPVVAPGEVPVTQAEIDAFNQIPVTEPMTGGITGDPITIENIGPGREYVQPDGTVINIDPLEEQMLLEELRNEELGTDTFTPTLQPEIVSGATDIFDINQTGDPTTTMLDVPTQDVGLAYTGEFDPDDEGTVFDTSGLTDATPEQQEGFLQNVLGQAGQTVEGALTQLGKIPGAIVDIANQTVDVFGKKLNVGKTLASLAVNKLVGAPVSLVFDVAKEFLPERDPRQNALDEFYDIKNGTIQSGIMKGYNPVSGGFPGISEPNYGLQETYDKRIDNTRNTLQEKYGLTNEELDSIEAGNITDVIKQKAISDEMSKAYGKPTTSNLVANLAELSDLKAREKDVIDAATTGAPQEDIGAISEDTGADPITGDLPGGGNIVDEFAPSDDKDDSPAPISTFDAEAEDEIYEEPTPTPPSPPQGGGGRDRDDGPAPSGPVSTAGQAGPPSQRGGGSSSAGGYGGGEERGSNKIVCSMMNEFYGFGSFRNKIWLRHSKNLSPEYEKGYHKIFLPLVNYAKKDGITNKIIKKIIEHLMVHRTIDIRQEARGKVHLLGRIYRKIFEPICYWVGKYAK